MTIVLLYIVCGSILGYDPYTEGVDLNVSISPLTTGTYYHTYPYFLTVTSQGGGRYQLINWTLEGTHVATGYVYNYSVKVLNNVTWPFSSLGTVDYEAGIAVTTAGISPPATGVSTGLRVMGASLTTGQLLFNVTTDLTEGYYGSFSGSTACADHGKFAIRLNDGRWHCWDLFSGKEIWVSEESSWPWGTFGAYAVQSAYGLLYYEQYDGVVAWDWNTGKIIWWYKDTAPYPYETPYQQFYAFRQNARIADGVLYTCNYEHTFRQPLTRGWKLHAINATT